MARRRGWSYFFINLVHKYFNDRAWFGMAFIAAGFGNLLSGVFPWWLDLPLGLVGIFLFSWGMSVDRRRTRTAQAISVGVLVLLGLVLWGLTSLLPTDAGR